MQQHIDFPMEISVLGNLMKTSLFKIYFLNNQKHACDKSLTFLVVACQDYHAVQLDLVLDFCRPKLS